MVLFFTLLVLLEDLSFCAPDESDSNRTSKSRRVALPRISPLCLLVENTNKLSRSLLSIGKGLAVLAVATSGKKKVKEKKRSRGKKKAPRTEPRDDLLCTPNARPIA